MSDRFPTPPSDRGAVVLALAAAAGAALALPVPVPVGASAVALAAVVRRPVLFVVAVFLLTAGLAAGAWAGLTPPAPGSIEGWATVRRDPDAVAGAVRVDLDLGGRRFDAWARGPAAGRIGDLATGDRAWVQGRIEPGRPPRYLQVRHLVARLTVDDVGATRLAGPPYSWANGVRDLLRRGVEHLPLSSRTLFAGFVLGDDRGQPPEVASDFRGAGLTHLLVVSGQNVAFVLLAAAPVLVRLRPPVRLLATLAVLGSFALLTRFEPSVLRATAMAAVATLAVVSGRPASGVRTLSLAVTGVLLVDPLLVGSLGFGLSVAASAGIVVLARPLAAFLPGPRWLALPLAVTLAAQLAVAPLLVPVTGGLPLATVPANLVAEPMAAVVVVWGMTAGLVAGVVGGDAAAWLHVPTGLALGAVAWVARVAASAPLGDVGLAAALTAGLLGVAAVLASRRHRTILTRTLVAASVLVVVVPASVPRSPPPAPEVAVDGGATLWQGGAPGGGRVLVVTSDARPDRLLDALRRHGVDRVDLLISVHGSRAAATVVRAVTSRIEVPDGAIWAPVEHRIPGATDAPVGRWRIGGLEVTVAADASRLEVAVAVIAGSHRPGGGERDEDAG